MAIDLKKEWVSAKERIKTVNYQRKFKFYSRFKHKVYITHPNRFKLAETEFIFEPEKVFRKNKTKKLHSFKYE